MDYHETVQQIFNDRGVKDGYRFLHPSVDDLLPLDDFTNIEEAADIVINAVQNGCKIGLLLDVDLDGITSGAIIYRYLKQLNADITPFINHGKAHGLQKNDIDKFKAFEVLIIVDSLDPTAYLYEDIQKNSNITDIVVLDHHAINSKIPYDKWITLVSSQRDYGNPGLSGAGVCWKFVKYLDSILNLDYADDLADLAAAGIIADMMDMSVLENRYIASKGLEAVRNPAINKIVGGFGWDSKAVSFSLAPVVNASNRLDKNEDAMMAFLVDDNAEVLKHVRVMKKCKDQQNEEIDAMMPDVETQCQKQLDKKMMVVFIESDYGIAGLLANKLMSKYKRPILVLKEEEKMFRGSMRAIGVQDFRKMLNDSGLARSFGHELAASCDVWKEDLDSLIKYMDRHLPDIDKYEEHLDADIWVNLSDINRDYINKIKELNRISGNGFKPIKVYIDGITDYEVTDMSKGKHLVIRPDDSDLTLIQWNFSGDWEYFKDAALMGDELECVCELQCGFIGRTFMLQGICDYVGVK